MTVIQPSVEECPECGSEELYGDMLEHYNVLLDGEGGIEFLENSDKSTAFETLYCSKCGHSLIEDGEIVDSSVTGQVV